MRLNEIRLFEKGLTSRDFFSTARNIIGFSRFWNASPSINTLKLKFLSSHLGMGYLGVHPILELMISSKASSSIDSFLPRRNIK
ncbi:MAG TPA: hypothetical protein PLV58_05265 [Campylobacterales bacterium]|nr:hypothetical protein [Campylobacterales bacterium]